jgi:hypothetical protein
MRIYDYFKTVFQVHVSVSSSGDTVIMAKLSRQKVEEVEIRVVLLSLDHYKLYQAAHPLLSLDHYILYQAAHPLLSLDHYILYQAAHPLLSLDHYKLYQAAHPLLSLDHYILYQAAHPLLSLDHYKLYQCNIWFRNREISLPAKQLSDFKNTLAGLR